MVVVTCPKCQTRNDLTEAARAEARTASWRNTITVEGKCMKCSGPLIHGPFDPWTAGVLPDAPRY